MAIGPGIYNEECTIIREQTKARGVILIVIDGGKGSGFACQADILTMCRLPSMLEEIAKEIRAADE